MRETTSSCGAASSSGSLNGWTPRQMPLASSSTLWNSAFGIVGTNSTPSTSSRASISAQPDFDIVVGTMIFLRLIPVLWAISSPPKNQTVITSEAKQSPPNHGDCLVASLLAMTGKFSKTRKLLDFGYVA